MKKLFLIAFLSGGIALTANAQDFHLPKPSPTVTVDQGFSTSFIKIKYSRPSMRGRVIFGQLVPYGKVWRTGANAATEITFGEDVSLAGHQVEAGTYALYTIPGEEKWQIILNTGVHNWGAAGFKKSDDVVEFDVPVVHHKPMQESFRISIENLTDKSCDIVLNWADVLVKIPVTTDNNKRILAHLDKALKTDKPPYAKAAAYYLATNQKLEDALKYTTLAIKAHPDAFYLYWQQAKIYQKLGNHEKALAAAKTAADMSKKHPAFTHEYEQHYLDMLNQK